MSDGFERVARPAPEVSIPLVDASTEGISFLPLVHDAVYENLVTGEQVIYLGAKGNSTLVLKRFNGSFIEVKYAEFSVEYKDVGVHAHDKSCCDVHGIHTSPHRGCLLR